MELVKESSNWQKYDHFSGVLFKKVVNLSGQIVQDGPKTKIFLLQASG